MDNRDQEGGNRAAYWLGQMQGWLDSGLSQANYYEARGISYHSFQYWRRRLSRDKEQAEGSLLSVVDLGRVIDLSDQMKAGTLIFATNLVLKTRPSQLSERSVQAIPSGQYPGENQSAPAAAHRQIYHQALCTSIQ